MSGGTSTVPTADRLGDGCEHLVVVAGLPCSGKTYLMEALRAGQADEVPEMLRPSPEGCAFLAVRDADPARVSGPQVYLHYDLHSNQVLRENRLLPPLLSRANRVTWATVLTPADVLRRRHHSRLEAFRAQLADPRNWRGTQTLRRLRRAWELRRLYRRPSAVERVYHDWLHFSAERSGEHFLVQGADGGFYFRAIHPLQAAMELVGNPPRARRAPAPDSSLQSAS